MRHHFSLLKIGMASFTVRCRQAPLHAAYKQCSVYVGQQPVGGDHVLINTRCNDNMGLLEVVYQCKGVCLTASRVFLTEIY